MIHLVFLPGLSYESTMWNSVMGRLSSARFHNHPLSLPEYGSPYKNMSLTMRTYAHYVHDALAERAVRDKVILIGQSLGGLIALHYASKYPDKVHAMVLTSTPLLKHPHKLNLLYRSGLAIGTRYTAADTLVKQGMRLLSYRNILHRTRFGYISKANFIRNGSLRAVCSCYQDIFAYDLRDVVTSVTTKTILMYGTRDTVLHKYKATGLYSALKTAHVRAVDAGHSIPIDKPEEVAQAVVDVASELC